MAEMEIQTSLNTQSLDQVQALALKLLAKGWSIACAESCTGGMVSAMCTDLAGSSQWFERGFVTYSNAAKHELLGVDSALIECHGAVSEEVARAMALGALKHSRAQVALAITGVAGPTGGSPSKPVGTVWFAWGVPGSSGPSMGAESAWIKTECCQLEGERGQVRLQAALHALKTMTELI